MGRRIPSIATSDELTFVALESLIHCTPSTSPTISSRCDSAWKVPNASAIVRRHASLRNRSSATLTASAAARALATL